MTSHFCEKHFHYPVDIHAHIHHTSFYLNKEDVKMTTATYEKAVDAIKDIVKLQLTSNGFSWTRIYLDKIKSKPTKRNIAFEVYQVREGHQKGDLPYIEDFAKFEELYLNIGKQVKELVSTLDPEDKGYTVTHSFSGVIPYIRIKPVK